MSLLPNPVSQICFKCLASRGNDNFDLVYTHIGEEAPWRRTVGLKHPWFSRPVLCDLIGDGLKAAALDLMHIWNLGVLRDLLGSIIKILCRRRGIYSGNRIAKRLAQFTRELRAFVREHKMQLSIRRIKQPNLDWKSDACPTLKAKAADCTVILQFCAGKLQTLNLPAYGGLAACTWSAQVFSGCLMNGGLFLTPGERNTALSTGRLFLSSYLRLCNEALENEELLFKMRPKYHYLEHLLDQLAVPGDAVRNPAAAATFMDEDWVKQAVGLQRKLSHRTGAHNVLRRFCVETKRALDEHRQKLR